MMWHAKDPPIYAFIGDYWIRETDKMVFSMRDTHFESRTERIEYTKKTKVLRQFYFGKNSEIEIWKKVI